MDYNTPTIDRRTVLTGIAAGAATGLAGCNGDGGDGGTPTDDALAKLDLEAVYAEAADGGEAPEVQVANAGSDIETVCLLPAGEPVPEYPWNSRYCNEVDAEERDRQPQQQYTYAVRPPYEGRFDVHVYVDEDGSPDAVDVDGSRRAHGSVSFEDGTAAVLQELSWAE